MDGAAQAVVADLGTVHEADPAETLFGMARIDGGIVEGAEAHPFLHDTLDIDIGDGQRGLAQEAAGFGNRLAQLMDQALAVPGQVGRALADPGGRIDIGASRTRRLSGGEHRPVACLSDDDVRRRQIAADRRPGERAQRRGRVGAQ